MSVNISLLEFIQQPLKPLPRISPSIYISLQQCPLKAIWASSGKPLLPSSPYAYLGTAIHQMLKLTFQSLINNEQELSEAWDLEIKHLEKEMLDNPIEKHLVPLEMHILNFDVKRLLAFKLINSLFRDSQGGSDNTISNAEDWVQTPDGKVVGRIDLVRKSGNGIEIIDYKTGSILEKSSQDKPKEEYLCQIKAYAALYHAMRGEWPVKLTLMGINQERVSIDVDSEECSSLLIKMEKYLDEINERIEDGFNPEDFAQPSPESCKFCLFRPPCNKYWESRQGNDNWPADVKGSIKEKTMLINGCFRIMVESEKGNVAIRGLSPERHDFLNDESTGVIFCNLGRDTSEGFYIENMLTTGYAIE